MLSPMGKKIFTILSSNFCLSKPMCTSLEDRLMLHLAGVYLILIMYCTLPSSFPALQKRYRGNYRIDFFDMFKNGPEQDFRIKCIAQQPKLRQACTKLKVDKCMDQNLVLCTVKTTHDHLKSEFIHVVNTII